MTASHSHAFGAVDTDAVEVVLHEEQLRIQTTRVPVERVRVRRRIVTETRTVEVTVRREELEVERLPVEGETAGGADDRAQPIVLTLSEEIPVVTTRTRPVERVTVTVVAADDEETVSAERRREQVEVATPERSPG